MGQNFYNPPNVRGWLYGQNWINSTTISGRRQLVDYLFTPVNEKKLNGNDRKVLEAARKNNQANFQVTSDRLGKLMKLDPNGIADHLTTYFITALSRDTYRPAIVKMIEENKGGKPYWNLRNTVIGLLQSPAYNLC
jgi:hypothetical protein